MATKQNSERLSLVGNMIVALLICSAFCGFIVLSARSFIGNPKKVECATLATPTPEATKPTITMKLSQLGEADEKAQKRGLEGNPLHLPMNSGGTVEVDGFDKELEIWTWERNWLGMSLEDDFAVVKLDPAHLRLKQAGPSPSLGKIRWRRAKAWLYLPRRTNLILRNVTKAVKICEIDGKVTLVKIPQATVYLSPAGPMRVQAEAITEELHLVFVPVTPINATLDVRQFGPRGVEIEDLPNVSGKYQGKTYHAILGKGGVPLHLVNVPGRIRLLQGEKPENADWSKPKLRAGAD